MSDTPRTQFVIATMDYVSQMARDPGRGLIDLNDWYCTADTWTADGEPRRDLCNVFIRDQAWACWHFVNGYLDGNVFCPSCLRRAFPLWKTTGVTREAIEILLRKG